MKRNFYSTFILALLLLLYVTGFTQGIHQLWGMTAQGGSADIGIVFRTDGEGNNAQSMHSFTRTNPGARPMYNQLTEHNGKFYSMTSAGGSNDLGVIFEWDPVSNIYTKKYDFEIANGINPHGSLVLLNSKFYGMTVLGGGNGNGVIFEWDPGTNIYIKKYDFNGVDGSNPYGSLAFNEGKFYGMTHSGGSNDLGVIFEWDPATNSYSKKYDFDGATGANPYGDLAVHDGKFYGMTYSGGNSGDGVIFEWEPVSNIYNKKHDFYYSNGRKPYGGLAFTNGKFYGMTYGHDLDFGAVIFEWDPVTNIYTKKIDLGFGGPYGNLLLKDDKFYGMTYTYFGKGVARGSLFEWDPVTNIYSNKYIYETNREYDNNYNGASPHGSLVCSSGKLYGMTSYGGGGDDDGVIFEWDPAGSGTYTKKINFNGPANGESPNGLVFQKGNLYGITEKGGADGLGIIFEWDFAQNKFIKKYDFDGITGSTSTKPNSRHPRGKLTFLNGKFYGMSHYALPFPTFYQHLFEWDPITNVFAQKGNAPAQPTGNQAESGGKLYGTYTGYGGGLFEWDPANNLFTGLRFSDFAQPFGGLAERAGKFYGMTNNGGTYGAGYIFEWDIATKTYTKKHDFDGLGGATPYGDLVFFKGLFYGVTSAGGSNNQGVIFEWDPVTNNYTKKYDFDAPTGSNPNGSLVLNKGKLYGMTKNGGNNNFGVLFEWDPATDIYTKKTDFTNSNGRNPIERNNLAVAKAPTAKGLPGNCLDFTAVTIDNNNNNEWVPIIDDNANAVAEIKANGNNLGVVNASVYINNSSIREDDAKRPYLDRNITITPEHQPASAVDIRLYISREEFEALKNVAGISTIADLGIFKNDEDCGPSVLKKAKPVATTGEAWETDYVLSARVISFSTFYFASKAEEAPLPLTLLEFSGRPQNNDALLNWKTENEVNVLEFIIERSIDGNQYKEVGIVAAANNSGRQAYNFTDPGINTLAVQFVYYRLKQKDIDGHFVYSKNVKLSFDNDNTFVMLYPNPANNELNLSINVLQRDIIKWQIIDVNGRIIKDQVRHLIIGNTTFAIDITKMAKGIYFLSIQGNTINKQLQFLKK